MKEIVGTKTIFLDEKNATKNKLNKIFRQKKTVRRNVRNHVKQYTIP